MYYYDLYGCIAQSNIEFPQLLSVDAGSANTDNVDIIISVINACGLKEKLIDPQNPEVGVGNTEYGMWFYNQAGTFLLEHKGNVSYMTCEKYDNVPDSIVRSFLLGNCIAIIMTYRKKLVLHGSTVVIGDKTVLVCGDSGSGKSTTAMALLAAGGKLLADDISVLDVDPSDGKVYSIPGFPEQKLCRDAAENGGLNTDELTYIDEDRDKFSVDRRDIFLTEKRKVDMLISLGTISSEKVVSDSSFVNGVRLRKIDGGEKVNAITNKFFLHWFYGKGLNLAPNEMMKCFILAGQIEIFDFTRVIGVDTKDILMNRILQIIKG